ncbi:MAG: cyanophycin synthetase [Bryobacterales bacterium]|nr:cyanophycin synthetase [Bryobacterales bacterium]
MHVESIRAIYGPNVYSSLPVLVMKLDLEDLAGKESYELPGFNDRLISLLPGVHEHVCGLGRRGGFVERLEGGTWFGHIVEHVALELTDAVGIPVNRGKTLAAGEPGKFLVAVAFQSEPAMRALLRTAVELVQALVDNKPYPLDEKIAEARELAERSSLGPSTQAILDAADARNIPWTRLDTESSLCRLGFGIHSRYVEATISGQTGAVAVDIASNKHLTKALLREAGLPAPMGEVATTREEALAAFEKIGAPVVVKPLDGNQGRGVFLNLQTADEVAEAFECASDHSRRVVIEELFRGRDYRVLVVNGRMVAASEKTPAHVIGTGTHRIRELIDITNRDPRRSEHHSKALSSIKVDPVMEAYLRRHGRSLDTVPAAGETVWLRESANLSTGGEARDVTDAVHPTMARMCERAARTIGLDICGIDFVVPDISQAWDGTGGIIEINAAPGIRMHEFPSEGKPRRAAAAIVDMLFPPPSDGRIPLISITGTNGKTTTTRMIAHAIGSTGKVVGTTSTDNIRINGVEVATGDMTGPWSARVVLSDPSVEVAVLETARGGIVRSGLGYDWADIGVITNIQPDHIGQDGIESVEDILRIKSLVAERVRQGGTIVLNADDPLLATLAENERIARLPRNIVFFSLGENRGIVDEHVARGGTAYVLNGEWIEEISAGSVKRIVRAAELPCTVGGFADFQIANVMATIAVCRAYGMSQKAIVSALMNFNTGTHNDGRLNIYAFGSSAVVLDYGHNPMAIQAIGRMLSRLGADRTTAVLGLPGDRAQQLIEMTAVTAARHFDRLVLREDKDLRGRQPGEMLNLMRRAIAAECPECEVQVIPDELEAFKWVVRGMSPGEAVVAFCEHKQKLAEWLETQPVRPLTDLGSLVTLFRHRLRIPA